MKRTVVIAILMAGYFLPAFAQSGAVLHTKMLQADSTLYQRSLQNNLPANNTWKYGNFQLKMNNAATDKRLLLPKVKGGNLNLAMTRPPEMEKMPCAKPSQKSRMPVSKPDSAVKHTMLVKKF
jgi:hypothetical protein